MAPLHTILYCRERYLFGIRRIFNIGVGNLSAMSAASMHQKIGTSYIGGHLFLVAVQIHGAAGEMNGGMLLPDGAGGASPGFWETTNVNIVHFFSCPVTDIMLIIMSLEV